MTPHSKASRSFMLNRHHESAKDFPVAGVSIHKRQRLEESNPMVQMDRNLSCLFELFENFATVVEPHKRAVVYLYLRLPAGLLLT